MSSHEYANKLKQLADFLLAKPDFDARTVTVNEFFWYWQDKQKFLDAVKALGSGRKEYEEGLSGDVLFYPSGLPSDTFFAVRVNRAAVCRKVQEEKWDCEPLLSQAEEAQVGA